MLHITSQGPRGLEYKCSITSESAEATISKYRHKLDKFALRRIAQTGIQWIEKAQASCLGATYLLLAVGILHVVVGSVGVVVAVSGGSWLLESVI